MIFAHGGMLCPLDLLAVVYGLPFVSAAYLWVAAWLKERRDA
jgi:hypothetical protein